MINQTLTASKIKLGQSVELELVCLIMIKCWFNDDWGFNVVNSLVYVLPFAQQAKNMDVIYRHLIGSVVVIRLLLLIFIHVMDFNQAFMIFRIGIVMYNVFNFLIYNIIILKSFRNRSFCSIKHSDNQSEKRKEKRVNTMNMGESARQSVKYHWKRSTKLIS